MRQIVIVFLCLFSFNCLLYLFFLSWSCLDQTAFSYFYQHTRIQSLQLFKNMLILSAQVCKLNVEKIVISAFSAIICLDALFISGLFTSFLLSQINMTKSVIVRPMKCFTEVKSETTLASFLQNQQIQYLFIVPAKERFKNKESLKSWIKC